MLRFIIFLFKSFLFLSFVLAALIWLSYWYFSKDLPTYQQLSEYRPPVISRIYAGDGSLIGEFAKERRLYTPIEDIPDTVKNAFVAAEDKNFYKHPGIDLIGILRATYTNISNIILFKGKRVQGASTITQQVMKNFLLTDERKIKRKIKEAILAVRFEETFSKEDILELYLNEIFLGARTYGVTAAAQAYFRKTPQNLSIAQAAYLAGLPKGPNNYHPIRKPEKALLRRNYVLRRMFEDGYINKGEYKIAFKTPLETTLGQKQKRLDTSYFVEEVRRDLVDRYSRNVLYNAGLSISATIDIDMQKAAEKSLRNALIAFDQKLGWRGSLAKEKTTNTPEDILHKYKIPRDLYNWDIALVTSFSKDNKSARIYIKNEKRRSRIRSEDNLWAVGKENNISNILSIGDVVYVSKNENNNYLLMQIPEVNGAFMVMDPHTGRVLAQQGGFTFSKSQFNRATQAKRQPGSAFKPFVYASALESGYSPATLVNDGEFYHRDSLGRLWKPENYDKKYLGNVTLRTGLERSRNLMTVRIAKDIGIKNVINFAQRFGVGDGMKPFLPMSLGAGEVTLEKMVTAYAVFANGGKKVNPVYYDRIQDRNGRNIVIADIPLCKKCAENENDIGDVETEYLMDPVTNYQMISMLEGVVKRGTGRRLKSLGIPVAGKTGTTNESKDVWFLGFTPDLVFGTYIGYDQPKPMGKKATGGSTAVPVIKDFLQRTMNKKNIKKFTVPSGVKFVQVNKSTGEYATNGDRDNIKEAFHTWQMPKKKWYVKKTFNAHNESDYQKPEHLKSVNDMINLGTGGLY